MNALFILALISAFATLAVMFTGAIGMAKGGDFNKKYGNKLMQARVGLQALTLVLLVLAAAA
ncbi:twin transmembrane helix small protein [Kordiimonas aquimaris]|uniref:twin transmembrane helix small protein n=1 Tax=Kordiimonas aquimaris TaxID=707591 RepID=UPI0021D3778F|nr:twin transmembrane helix small protein [Kordiimonas aquimaris]